MGWGGGSGHNRDGALITMEDHIIIGADPGFLKRGSILAGIPPGKSDASGGIGPRHIVTSTSGFSARCRPMRPIFPVEFQL